jgi:hypothetical protein
MPRPRRDSGAGEEGDPQTQPMPLADVPEYGEWVGKQKRPTQKDKGKQPPKPKELAEPREPGTTEPVE